MLQDTLLNEGAKRFIEIGLNEQHLLFKAIFLCGLYKNVKCCCHVFQEHIMPAQILTVLLQCKIIAS